MPSAPVAPHVQTTPHFRIHFTPRSFAEQNLPLIANRLESAYSGAVGMLGVDLQGAMIDVHLSELVIEYGGMRLGGGGYAVPRRMQIHDLYLPDSPGESLERSLIVLLLALATGNDREPPALIVDGLHSNVMQRLGAFLSADQVTAHLAEAKARGELPALTALLDGPS
ncbi:MAG: hypothetical protein JOZ41_04290, partial [Chloroflexi bacterium]|nr:hypothetical protein [Chloroflexota bacterium]